MPSLLCVKCWETSKLVVLKKAGSDLTLVGSFFKIRTDEDTSEKKRNIPQKKTEPAELIPETPSASQDKKIYSKKISLGGIMYSGEHSRVLINGRSHKIGDTVEGYLISDILADRVVMLLNRWNRCMSAYRGTDGYVTQK